VVADRGSMRTARPHISFGAAQDQVTLPRECSVRRGAGA
jgi:hypothetical protein